MSIQVIVTLSVELAGDDYSTHEPDVQRVVLPSSPAAYWQYQLEAANNYLLVSLQNPPSALFLDPQAASGATWTLKGSTLDVGIPIGSDMPSLIPVAQTTPIGATAGGQAPQFQVVLSSSVAQVTQVLWV